MKIHPLFDRVIGVVFTGEREVGSRAYHTAFNDWKRSGKPVCEEEPRLAYQGVPWHLFPFSSATEANNLLATKDARIAELERRLAYWNTDEGYGRHVRNAALESVLQWGHEEKDLSQLLNRVRSEIRKA